MTAKKAVNIKFKKGDRVKVMRKAETFEKNWNNAWVDEMNISVGKTLTVIKDEGTIGVRLNDEMSLSYPSFVLEKVKKKVVKK